MDQQPVYRLATGVHAQICIQREGGNNFRFDHEPTRRMGGLPAWMAIKIVRANISGTSEARRPHDIALEVHLLTKLEHPNIIEACASAWSAEPLQWRVFLPLLAFSLAELQAKQILETASQDAAADVEFALFVRSVTFQLLLGIAHIHALDVAHRDIKPANIMLGWDGSVKLIDFGTAFAPAGSKIREDMLQTHGRDKGWKEPQDQMVCDVGTSPYRAPEVLFAPRTYDAQALDLWALGATLTEFLSPLEEHTHPVEETEDRLELPPRPGEQSKRRKTLFSSGWGDIGLASSIFRIRGSPTPERWPEFTSLPSHEALHFPPSHPVDLAPLLPDLKRLNPPSLATSALDLIENLLQLSPPRRMKATAALGHPFLTGDPVLVPHDRSWFYGEGTGRVEMDPSRVRVQIRGVTMGDLLSREMRWAEDRLRRGSGRMSG